MDVKHAYRLYYGQAHAAKQRGIGWEFTFDSWLAWWGDDIERRGRGALDLCMSRTLDAGPYRPDNVAKATNAQNRRTAAAVLRKRATDRARLDHQAALDRAMWLESAPPADDVVDAHQLSTLQHRGMKNSGAMQGAMLKRNR